MADDRRQSDVTGWVTRWANKAQGTRHTADNECGTYKGDSLERMKPGITPSKQHTQILRRTSAIAHTAVAASAPASVSS